MFGYVPLLDITMRGDEDRSYRKSFDTFTPIGPEIVTADEVGDPGALELELRLNGELRQRASTCDLIHDVPRLIERYSEVITLEPGRPDRHRHSGRGRAASSPATRSTSRSAASGACACRWRPRG